MADFLRSFAWQSLYSQLFSCTYNIRSFKALFGVGPDTCTVLWACLFSLQDESPFEPRHLLFLLCYCKTYESLDALSSRFRVAPKTFHKRIFQVAEALANNLKEVLSLSCFLSPTLSQSPSTCSSLAFLACLFVFDVFAVLMFSSSFLLSFLQNRNTIDSL